jgi:hypothetical protein
MRVLKKGRGKRKGEVKPRKRMVEGRRRTEEGGRGGRRGERTRGFTEKEEGCVNKGDEDGLAELAALGGHVLHAELGDASLHPAPERPWALDVRYYRRAVGGETREVVR